MAYYGSIDSVLIRTGVKPEDLGFTATDEEESGDIGDDFGDFIESLLIEVSDLMNRWMRRDWNADVEAETETAVPAGMHGIANDVASDSLRTMVVTRQTPVVRIDDFAVRVVTARLFSADTVMRMRLYSAGRSAVSVDLGAGDLAGLKTTFTVEDLNT